MPRQIGPIEKPLNPEKYMRTPRHNLAKWEPEGLRAKILALYARKVPNHPAKIRIFRWLAYMAPRPVFHYREKVRFKVILKDYIGHAICFQGSWEPLSMVAALRIMEGHEKMTFLDIGANHGIFTLMAGGMTGCPCVAVEPMERNYQILQENLLLNPEIRVQTFLCAAAGENTRVYLSSEKTGAEAWTRITGHDTHQDTKSVEGRPLSQILQDAKCHQVRLMKIDVEGFEVEVFKGLDWSAPFAPEVVLMECQPCDTEKISFLTQRGYRPETVDGRSPVGLPEYPEGNLIFRRE